MHGLMACVKAMVCGVDSLGDLALSVNGRNVAVFWCYVDDFSIAFIFR